MVLTRVVVSPALRPPGAAPVLVFSATVLFLSMSVPVFTIPALPSRPFVLGDRGVGEVECTGIRNGLCPTIKRRILDEATVEDDSRAPIRQLAPAVCAL